MAEQRERWEVFGGSVVGREHVRLHRNSQDGLAIGRPGELLVAAVTDGCSAGRQSEVGARLAAWWLVEWAPVVLAERPGEKAFAHAMADGLTEYLERLVIGLGPRRSARKEVVREFLLFTFLCCVVDPERTILFGVGDGLVSVNGETRCLESGPGNAPDYLGYRLLSASAFDEAPEYPDPVVHHSGATGELRRLILGTDGAQDLEFPRGTGFGSGCRPPGLDELADDPRYTKNPTLLQKRLTVLGERRGLLLDDTTLVVVRRAEG